MCTLYTELTEDDGFPEQNKTSISGWTNVLTYHIGANVNYVSHVRRRWLLVEVSDLTVLAIDLDEVDMLSSLPKRPASASPDGDRPSKRQATSSPEEGELDDASPPPVARLRSPSPPKSSAKPPGKVPFPFKKKTAPPENGVNGAAKDRSGGGVHEREDERRYRDEDNHRRYGLPPRADDRSTRPWGADKWEPGPGRYDRPRWEAQSYVPEPRAYPRSPERRSYRSPSPPPLRHRDRRPVSRSRSPPSPRSRSPRSPSSPRSPLTPSSGKEKHRLPPSRPVVPDPATYRPLYERERWRDEDDRWGRRRSPIDRYDAYRDGREGSYY